MEHFDLRETEIAEMLVSAINAEKVQLLFQPKFIAITNELIGVETLIRWNDPVLGFIPPSVFIPIAERCGVIEIVTEYVIKKAVKQCASWNDEGVFLNVAINISTHDLHNDDFISIFYEALTSCNVDPTQITFEITETVMIEDREQCANVLTALRVMGTKLSIDDFGTGHAAFVYLKHFPVTEIKIDKMFVDDLLKNSFDAKLVRYTIDLAHDLSCKVVAEGIEDAQTAHALRMLSCDTLQGYYLCKPITAQAVSVLASENKLMVNEYA